MRAMIGSLTLVLGISALGVGAFARSQSPETTVTMTPITDLRPEAMYDGIVESPNGRFVGMLSEKGEYIRFDRTTREWATAPSLAIGRSVRMSPDGRYLAYPAFVPSTRERSVWIAPLDTATGLPNGTPRRVSTHSSDFPAWSPDGRRLAIATMDSGVYRVVLIPFNGGEEEVLYKSPDQRGELTWSSNGEQIYIGPGQARPTRRVRVNTRTRRADSLSLRGNVTIGESRDGKTFAEFSDFSRDISITSTADGRLLQTLKVPRNVAPTSWSRTQPNVILARSRVYEYHLKQVTLANGTVSTLTPIDTLSLGSVMHSPDGKQLAAIQWGPMGGQFVVMAADGSGRRAVGKVGDISGGEDGAFDWSPNGRQIAYRSGPDGVPGGAVHVLDVTTGEDRILVSSTAPTFPAGRVAWRSDGQAVRYMWWPRGAGSTEREAREVTMAGQVRVLAQAPVPAHDLLTLRQTEPHFINDTLLLLRNGKGVGAVNLRTGASRALYTGNMRPRNQFGVSPDGQWIAFGIWEGEKSIPLMLSLTTGEQRRVPYSLGAELGLIEFHPDGRHLAALACTSCSDGNEYFDVVLIPVNGDPTRGLTASERNYRQLWPLSVAPDGRSIVFGAEKSWNTRVVNLGVPQRQ